MQPDTGDSKRVAKTTGKPKHRTRFGAFIGGGMIALMAFTLGMGIGDGRIAVHATQSKNTNLPDRLNYSSVDQVYNVLRKEYDGTLDQTKLLDGMKEGMAQAAGDPYTEYFTADEYKKFEEQLNGSGFSGIGAELGFDKDKNLVVVAPIAGMPAAKAGLKSQDIIAEIDGKSTSGMTVDEGVSKIRGKKGTNVMLTVIRNKSESIKIAITRDNIVVPSVDSRVLDDGTTGYMRITTFGDDTGVKATEAANDLKQKGVKRMVLDLRGNPGGVVDSAIRVASLWLPKGKLVMQEKRGDTVTRTYTADGGSVFEGIPTAVLIDEGSASASEIVSGALHDNAAAKLYGTKSYGKGVVQGIEPMNDGSQLKVTIARWYRPNGQNINKVGITPDQTVTLSDQDAAAGNDTQLKAAETAMQ